MSNRLSGEKSPYLKQHKDNPVDWYPWGREAFQKAAAEDKPVFLSIGYSTCHWCHVMARESFEDERVAELLQPFVCIKVDREERPDIDAVYMEFCQAFTGSGGWPLTVWMTPDQKPFFIGTYFPKNNRYGQPGLSELLREIAFLWQNDRERLIKSGSQLLSLIQIPEPKAGVPNRTLFQQAFQSLYQSFDPVWGGFGEAPKFPTPATLLFCMHYFEAEGDKTALQMVETTLVSMAAGGIFDHIGGGFSRYSTDRKWLIPHFEKMLYDNALLLLAYLEAYQLTGKEAYADTVRRVADYLLRELRSPEGGFYCGQDADSDGREGSYYILTPEEVETVLGERDGKEFCRLYHITPEGYFEGGSIPNRMGASSEGWKKDDPRLHSLLEYRRTRCSLSVDRKILVSWNGWTILALARAGLVLQDTRYTRAAAGACEWIEKHMTDSHNRLYRRFCDGEAAFAGQLEDYASFTLSLLELYRTTLNIRYLERAVFRADQMHERFSDAAGDGYFMTSQEDEPLIRRLKETYDGAIPSGNSAAAMVLEKLAALTGEPVWQERAHRQHRFMAGQAQGYPSSHCFWLLSLMHALYPHKELIGTGQRTPEELFGYLRDHPAHHLSILYKSPENETVLSRLAPFTAFYPVAEQTAWYLCEKGACRAPETDFDKLPLSLRENNRLPYQKRRKRHK